MRKNISINIGGIIFHIEENSYERLRNYLSGINKYFASYEESAEIISDIENRIAEIFLAKLSEHKQVITLGDVNDLIATMGDISDFEAAGEVGEQTGYQGYGTDAEGASHERPKSAEPKLFQQGQDSEGRARKLYRDLNRKILGGVCAGLAYYIKVDPLWVRLIFVLSLFDIFYFQYIPQVAFLSYLLMWVFLPGSDALSEDRGIKRLFRDPDDKVIGGVASGLAAYFGVEVNALRVLFALALLFSLLDIFGGSTMEGFFFGFSVFLGGAGLLTYLVLWFITPEAKTLTERMQMEGEPVTLKNIEKKIKESFNIDDAEGESLFTQILLFPFRLIAAIVRQLEKNFRPLSDILLKLFTTISGISLLVFALVASSVLFVVFGVILNLFNLPPSFSFASEIPLFILQNTLPEVATVFSFLTIWVPVIFIGVLGVSLVGNKMITTPAVNWSFLGVWIIALIGSGVSIPLFLTEFQTEAVMKNSSMLEMPKQPLLIGLRDNQPFEFDISEVELTIKGHAKDQMILTQWFESRGKTRQDALKNAAAVSYNFEQVRNDLFFNAHYELGANKPFRGQSLKMELLLPYNKPFKMSKDLGRVLRHTLYPWGYGVAELGENQWLFDSTGALRCITCQEQPTERGTPHISNRFQFSDFNSLMINGDFQVRVAQDDDFLVELIAEGSGKEAADLVEMDQKGDQLIINPRAGGQEGGERLILDLRMPSLKKLHLTGRNKLDVRGFEEEEIQLLIEGSADANVHLDAEYLIVSLVGDAKLALHGDGEKMDLEATGRSQLNAYGYEAAIVNVRSTGANIIEVFADDVLNIMATSPNNVHYQGDPDAKNVLTFN